MTTIEELKKQDSFIVEEWVGITIRPGKNETTRSGGSKISEYMFFFEGNDMYVTGDVFGKEQYIVLNTLEVLFGITKEYTLITVNISGLDLKIRNPILRLPE